jgi:hypothetical protein
MIQGTGNQFITLILLFVFSAGILEQNIFFYASYVCVSSMVGTYRDILCAHSHFNPLRTKRICVI